MGNLAEQPNRQSIQKYRRLVLFEDRHLEIQSDHLLKNISEIRKVQISHPKPLNHTKSSKASHLFNITYTPLGKCHQLGLDKNKGIPNISDILEEIITTKRTDLMKSK